MSRISAKAVRLVAISGCVFLCAAALSQARAQRRDRAKPKAEVNTPVVDSKADEALRRMTDYLRDAENFRLKSTMDWRAKKGNASKIEKSRYTIAFVRPNRLALVQKGGDVGMTLVHDGDRMFAHIPHRESYAIEEGSKTIEDVSDVLAMGAQVTNMRGLDFVRALLQEDPYEALMEDVTKLEHVGTQRIDGKKNDHIRLTRADDAWDLWIAKGKKPVVTRFETKMPLNDTRVGDVNPFPRASEAKIRVAFTNWKIDRRIRDKVFRIKVPKKTQSVSTVLGLAQAYPPHPILGKKAPKLKLDLYGDDGGKLNLSKLKGDNIVVLDFWATWCGPCIMALPDLIEVTDKFKDQGVVFFGVNQREGEETIKAFLDAREFDFTIAFDLEGSAGSKYEVNGIPQTVIIDKRGIVQAVHRGYSPDMKEMLTEELETLLAGESLVD